ncbi:MAG: elongation factor G [Actinomycetota bacterium]|nr:elongation factor G [Actinomycetota bacterium]
MSFPTDKIRNVALVGHGGSGKTTLAEALLHVGGATKRLGRVEDGTTVCDHDPEEHARGFSLSLAVAPLEWKGHKINLLDTPGYADFIGDAHAALRVADLAVFVLSAVDGVQVQTEVLWRAAADLGLPRMVFINKLDKERASFDRVLDELRDRFGAGIAPLELPIGAERDFCGVADLLTDTAWLYVAGEATRHDIPDDMAGREQQVHENLVEGIVVGDDDLMERYLDGEMPSVDQLEATLAIGVDEASVFPVVCGSALAEIGIDRLADLLCEIGPSPLDRPPVEVIAGDATSPVAADPAGQPLALVFKTVADQFVGHVTQFKVLSGTIRADDHLVNPRSGNEERLHTLFTLHGRAQEPINEVMAGDIAAVSKLAATATGDTLAPKGTPVTVPRIEFPEPLLGVAIKARTQTDDDKLANALPRLLDEDPALAVDRDGETHQTILRGIGDTHLAVAFDRLQRKFGVAVDTEDVLIAYRETISGMADVEGRHKKQSGGHGQFGVCSIRVSPRGRGEGFEFVDKIVGGSISRAYIPAVQRGVEEAMGAGGVFGYPVVDLRVELYDGKEHSVDSSEMAFRAAGRLALRAALVEAEPVLLEPVSQVTIVVPTAQQGDVMGDLNARRGRVQGARPVGTGEQAITALVPASELLRYPIELRSLTSGRGRYTARHDHYDIVPSHLVERVRRDRSHED